jgi:hypothetical protein
MTREQTEALIADVLLPNKRTRTLADCPIGLFMDAISGTLCLKTEYGNNDGRIDAYIVSSGEFYWGPAPQNIANQRKARVYPVKVADLDAAGLCIVDKSVVEALRECASAAYVSIDQCMDYDQINGWRNIATARIDIAKAALATLEAGG